MASLTSISENDQEVLVDEVLSRSDPPGGGYRSHWDVPLITLSGEDSGDVVILEAGTGLVRGPENRDQVPAISEVPIISEVPLVSEESSRHDEILISERDQRDFEARDNPLTDCPFQDKISNKLQNGEERIMQNNTMDIISCGDNSTNNTNQSNANIIGFHGDGDITNDLDEYVGVTFTSAISIDDHERVSSDFCHHGDATVMDASLLPGTSLNEPCAYCPDHVVKRFPCPSCDNVECCVNSGGGVGIRETVACAPSLSPITSGIQEDHRAITTNTQGYDCHNTMESSNNFNTLNPLSSHTQPDTGENINNMDYVSNPADGNVLSRMDINYQNMEFNNKMKNDENPVIGYTADKSTSDQTTSDQTTSDQTTSDKSTSDQTTSDKSTSDQTTSDKSTSDQTTSDQTTSDQTTSDKSTSDQTTSDKSTSDKSTSDQTTSDKSTSDQTTSDKSTSGVNVDQDQTTSAVNMDQDQTTSDQTTSDKSTSDQTTSDQTTSDKSTSDKSTSDKSTSDQTASDQTTSGVNVDQDQTTSGVNVDQDQTTSGVNMDQNQTASGVNVDQDQTTSAVNTEHENDLNGNKYIDKVSTDVMLPTADIVTDVDQSSDVIIPKVTYYIENITGTWLSPGDQSQQSSVKLGSVELSDPGSVELSDPGSVELSDPGSVELSDPGSVELSDPGSVEQSNVCHGSLGKSKDVVLVLCSTIQIQDTLNDVSVYPGYRRFYPSRQVVPPTEWQRYCSGQRVLPPGGWVKLYGSGMGDHTMTLPPRHTIQIPQEHRNGHSPNTANKHINMDSDIDHNQNINESAIYGGLESPVVTCDNQKDSAWVRRQDSVELPQRNTIVLKSRSKPTYREQSNTDTEQSDTDREQSDTNTDNIDTDYSRAAAGPSGDQVLLADHRPTIYIPHFSKR